MTTLSHLECSRCGRTYEPAQRHGVCQCGAPLLARYDLELARRSWSREWVRNGPSSMWRYAPVLPVRKPGSMVSLGEGMTPLIRAARLGERLGVRQLWIKDEGVNPTGSVKARGMACAVSMAVELDLRRLALASGGNAAAALAACAAAAGRQARIFLPRSVFSSAVSECRACGAHLTLVDGWIPDCLRLLAACEDAGSWYDLSALREPYRLEGAKTLGYELAEQFNWDPPDVVLYPAGEGLSLIAVWKAFQEMEALGWISDRRPRLIAVQSERFPPLVQAFRQAGECRESVGRPATVAAELAAGKSAGDPLLLEALTASGGTAVAVSDAELLKAGLELAKFEGILPAPEGAACVAALAPLLAEGVLDPGQRIVIANPGSGLKRLQAYAGRLPREQPSEAGKPGGLITPR